MWFFYIFIFSVLLLGSFKVGPFSLRVYMVLLMMGYLLLTSQKKANYRIPNKFLRVFLLYIVVTGMILSLTGEYQEYGFTNLCLAFYLPCFVTVAAINRFIDTKESFIRMMWFIVGLIFINCIVTQLQYHGIVAGKLIAMALSTSLEVQTTIMSDNDIDASLLMGEGLPIGLFGFVFTNANYSATFGVIPLFTYFLYESNTKVRIASLFILLVCVYNCFMIQERTAFFGLSVMAAYLLYKNGRNKSTKTMLLFVLAIFILPSVMSSGLGRLTEFSAKEDSRNQVWTLCFSFIGDHLLLGGPVAYSRLSEIAPHNYFLIALITSGLIGGIIAITLYIKSSMNAIQLFMGRTSPYTKVMAASVIIYAFGCLFHNASIITGDTLFFILYALMIKCSLMENEFENENTMLYR
ncbi:hypothetical protein SAMN05216253_103182 [Bacteroides thetaiotaomicron]|uniref:O-antigen ligase family protein n=1 Tax=Bacteroides thetaiotaomicron TaxID=818 RepID=UPI00089FB642|nr:hypothetical protein [Bacteroides thetaiotaomicron]MBS5446924.1 hypothetical protein [Bacteroides thetaiotaomicron]SEF81548.1 hypothetical protein SAMN05216253_103182 [Bacteroides thetaiotaomicron]